MLDFVNQRKIKIKRRRLSRKQAISTFFVASIAACGILFFGAIGLFAWYAKDLPNPDKIQRKEGFSTIIYDRDGEVLYDIFADQNRIPVEIGSVPEHLKQATVAIEDKEFFTHQGYSTRGILRSLIKMVMTGDIQGGGSTLTQQLVKNVLLSAEQTLPRKIKEFILAVQIERKYSKDEILQMYLNEAPYGGTAWGVESAAKLYFGKSTRDLDLVESAILAGFPQLPSRYSPYTGEADAYIGRAEHVLRRMREDGYINSGEEKKAKEVLPYVTFVGRKSGFLAPHFVTHVRKLLEEQFGEDIVESGGLRVTTTLDLSLQTAAEEIITEELEKVESLNVGNGAVVVIDPQTGEILTMVGSKNYFEEEKEKVVEADTEEELFSGKFNVATQGLRQPGSALKPIVYATAFEKGYTPGTLIMDVPTEFYGGENQKPYKPENYDGKFRGPVQMRFALGNSINVPAVKTLSLIGLEEFLATAHQMGLATLEPTRENMNRFGLSIALGGGEVRLIELANAYSVFAAGGVQHDPVAILKVQDKNGKTIFEHKNTGGEQVISPEVSFLISHILSDNNARIDVFGPNSWLNIPGKTVAVKTGTTDDKRDNWTIGFTKEVTVGVWVGNNDNSEMNPKLASGVTGAAPIWNRVMRESLREYSDGVIDQPKNIVALEIDAYGGGLPKDGQPIRSEYFIKGTEPTSVAPIYQNLKLSKRQGGKLASADEIRMGDYEEKSFIVLNEDDPVSPDGKNRWQEGIDKWLEGTSDEKYHPPKEMSDVKIEEEKKDEPTKTPSPTPDEDSEVTPTSTPSPTP